MTAINPRTTDEVYESLKSNLKGKINKLTNFAENSFNFVWTQAFAEEQHEEEVAALAVQLSGWAEYAGKEITQEDLDELGITGATPEEVNEYINEDHLDELGKLMGVTRDPGEKAIGEVEITTNSAVTIDEGTKFGTQPGSEGDFRSFFTTETVNAGSATTVTASIQAESVGDEYNVGAGTITYMPNPPVGVDSVTNPSGTTGGTDIQSNDGLRQDIQNAVIESSGGGTKTGVESYIEDNTEAIDVIVQEKFTGDSEHGNYPHGDVVVLGGTDQEVQDAIDFSHPSAVEHILIRPTQFGINVDADVEGTDINTTAVEDDIAEYFDQLLLGDDVIRDKIIQTIMNADPDIDNITPADAPFISINKEGHTFTGETVDDFEDNDITVADSDWSGWNGDTGALTAVSSGVISGSYSGQLASSNASNTISATRSSTTDSTSYRTTLNIDSQTGNSGDAVRIELLSGGTTFGYLEFDGAGNVDWFNGADNNITTWTAGTEYQPKFEFDYTNDEVTVTVGGNSGTFALQNSVSDFDEINISNITTASAGSVNVTFDDVEHYDLVYVLDKGEYMEQDNAITAVEDDSGDTYTEGTDFTEFNSDGDTETEAIKWLNGGSSPDVGEGFAVTYRIDEDIPIDITEVANAGNITVQVV